MESSVVTFRDLPSVRVGVVCADPVLRSLQKKFQDDPGGVFQALPGPGPDTGADGLLRHATTLDLCLLSSRATPSPNALLGVFLPHCPVVLCDCPNALDAKSLGFGGPEPKFLGRQAHAPLYVLEYLVLPLLRSFDARGGGRRKWVTEYPVFLYKLRRVLNG